MPIKTAIFMIKAKIPNPTEEEFETSALTTNLMSTKFAVNNIHPAATPKAICLEPIR